DDIFAVQDEVVQSILSALPGQVEAADLEKWKQKSTAQMAAYDYFLRGRELHHKFNQDDCREGVRCLEKAVDLDPEYAQAWAWLGCTVGQAWIRGYLPDAQHLWKRCVDASKRALELDEEDSECHRLMSEIYLLQNKFAEALSHNERGLALNPNNPRLVVQRGYLLVYTGDPEQGISWIEKVIRLDPMHPENYYSNLAVAFHAAKKYQDAIKIFKRISALQPTQMAYLVSCYVHTSDLDSARAQARAIVELDPNFLITRFAKGLHYKNEEDKEHLLEALRSVDFHNT
ncbi:MAG: tetratricopeptide repeat protein, partial [Gammaproteobacteria bacterium]